MSTRWFPLLLWRILPAAAFMGLRLDALDDRSCTTRLTLGWRNRNPFRSMYFAAQMAAAEMASGLPAFLMIRQGGGRVSMLVVRVDAQFLHKATGRVLFTFGAVQDLRRAIERASGSQEPVLYDAEVTAVGAADDTVLATFRVQWRFRARVSGPQSAR